MTEDIILDTTSSFISTNMRNLELAFYVEESLPRVRKKFIEDFFKDIEKRLKEKVETTEEWEVKAIGTEGLWIRKNRWEQLKVGEHSKDWWGIRLLPKKSGWARSSISVANTKEISADQTEMIGRKFKNYRTGGPYIWRYLNDGLEDFERFAFLKKLFNKEDREIIIKDVVDELYELADEVDKVLWNTA